MEIKGREMVFLSLFTLLLGGWQFWMVKPQERLPNAVYLPSDPPGAEIFAPGANSEYGFKLKPIGHSPGPLHLTLDERVRFVFVLKAPGYQDKQVVLTREQLARGETVSLEADGPLGPIRSFLGRYAPALLWLIGAVAWGVFWLRPRLAQRQVQEQLAASGRWKPGLVVNGYELAEEVGRGGMAQVFRAARPGEKEDLAFKGLRPEQTRHREAFEREVKLWKGLSHPGIVHLLDWGEFQGALYLVCELVDGGTLEEPPGREPAQVCDWMLQVLEALGYAHDRGIVHRDLKPANLLWNRKGQVFLTDFGVAASVTDGEGGGGTVGFAPPEQLEGEIRPEHDFYALGVTFYSLLQGQKPFSGDPAQILAAQKEGRYPPLEISPLGSLVEKLLHPEPESRLTDPDRIAQALRDFKADTNSSTEA